MLLKFSFTMFRFMEMAEEEGFEPPRGLTRLSVFKTDPFSRTWVFLRYIMNWWTLQDSNL